MFLDEYIENQISPTLQASFNAGYRMENTMTNTEFRDTFKGKKEEETDKIYFRKADEVAKYAEAMFKTKGLLGGKK